MLESRTYSPSNGATSNTPNHPIASLFLSSYPMQLEIYMYQLSQTDPRDAMTRASCCSIHLDVNAQWDKLAEVIGRKSTVASSVNFRLTKVTIVYRSKRPLCRTKLTARCYDRRVVAKFP